MTKKCPTCKLILPTTDFYTNKARHDGLGSHCKKCQLARSKRLYSVQEKIVCKYCGKYFMGGWNKVWCRKCELPKKPISGYKTCEICSKQFPYRESNKVRTTNGMGYATQRFCSKECVAIYTTQRNKSKEMIERNKSIIGEKRYNWKGQDASYSAIHIWLRNTYGNATICEKCGTKDSPKYEWANISQTYIRDIKDFMQLCTKCHHKYDETLKKGWETRRKNKAKTPSSPENGGTN